MNTETNPAPTSDASQAGQPPAFPLADGSASAQPYDPLESLNREVDRFMRTNIFTPMEVTGFYIQARCVIAELRSLRTENEHLRNVRDRQAAIIRRHEKTINEYEEQAVDDGRF